MTARSDLHAAFVAAMQDGNWHMAADEDHAKATAMVDAAISEALHAAAEKIRGYGDPADHWAANLIDPEKQEQP